MVPEHGSQVRVVHCKALSPARAAADSLQSLHVLCDGTRLLLCFVLGAMAAWGG